MPRVFVTVPTDIETLLKDLLPETEVTTKFIEVIAARAGQMKEMYGLVTYAKGLALNLISGADFDFEPYDGPILTALSGK